MKRFWIVTVMILILAPVIQAQSSQLEASIERPFTAGGKVHLKLASGDYTIRAGRDDRIRVRWIIKKPENYKNDIERRVRIEAFGLSANVRTDDVWRDSHFIIEVPARSDVYLRVRAGDVKVQGIEGNKDIQMTAGDLEIDLNPSSYSIVRASVTFGDLSARPLRISKGGIARSFDWQGSGTYLLRAKLFAGDLTLREISTRP